MGKEDREMIKAGIIGATGYAGAELVRILSAHPDVQIEYLGSRSFDGIEYSSIFGDLKGVVNKKCTAMSMKEMAAPVDVIFTATPQGFCASQLDDEILQNTKIIDLSADFRLKDSDVYKQWYGIEQGAPEYLDEAVYGLCEINREKIKKPGVRIIANPGCFTTCSILTVWPLAAEGLVNMDTLVIDGKSGVSGAGRSGKVQNLFCEVNESVKGYGLGTHRHTPEIEEQLGYAAGKPVTVSFTPYLVPMERGILISAYASLNPDVSSEDIKSAYEKYYGNEEFVRILPEGQSPETRWVKNTNMIDIGFKKDPRTNRVIMLGAIDNLVKGAAGQAVQNMNLLFGFPENTGLTN